MTYRDKVVQAMSHALGWDASDLFYGLNIKTDSRNPKVKAKIMAYEVINRRRRADSRYINFMCSVDGESRNIMEKAIHMTGKDYFKKYEEELARLT